MNGVTFAGIRKSSYLKAVKSVLSSFNFFDSHFMCIVIWTSCRNRISAPKRSLVTDARYKWSFFSFVVERGKERASFFLLSISFIVIPNHEFYVKRPKHLELYVKVKRNKGREKSNSSLPFLYESFFRPLHNDY